MGFKKNKIIPPTLLLIFFLQNSYGQGIFNQKQTQRKYTIQQIAYLKIYLEFVKKGYKVVNDGINTAKQIRDGELNLHKLFFNSLKIVNQKIKKYPKVDETISYQYKIFRIIKQVESTTSKSLYFRGNERQNISRITSQMATETQSTVDDLNAIITDGKFEINDADRIKRIDIINSTTRRILTAAITLLDQVSQAVKISEQEEKDIQQLKDLYNPNTNEE